MIGSRTRYQLEFFVCGSLRDPVPDDHILYVNSGTAKGEIVHIDAPLIHADVSWDSLVVRHVDAVKSANSDPAAEADAIQQTRNSRKTGKFKKVCPTDPDATMATNGRKRRLEPSYKQHGVVDDVFGMVLDVDVTTGETNEGEEILSRLDTAEKTTGARIETVTADAGYVYAKIYVGLERREIAAIIPYKVEPIRSPVPMRRFRCDAKHDVLKCPRCKKLKAGRAVKHGRFFTSRTRDCRGCGLAQLCLSKGRVNKAVVVGDDYPALLCARRRREKWSEEDRDLYQRHRWRSEGYHGEAKTWHGLARAVRRGLAVPAGGELLDDPRRLEDVALERCHEGRPGGQVLEPQVGAHLRRQNAVEPVRQRLLDEPVEEVAREGRETARLLETGRGSQDLVARRLEQARQLVTDLARLGSHKRPAGELAEVRVADGLRVDGRGHGAEQGR